jgi:hypothetical protein
MTPRGLGVGSGEKHVYILSRIVIAAGCAPFEWDRPPGGEKRAMEDLRQARHNLLGRLNSIKMCAFALETMKPHEAVEFLEMIESATDRAIAALDAFDEAFDRDPAAAADVLSRR